MKFIFSCSQCKKECSYKSNRIINALKYCKKCAGQRKKIQSMIINLKDIGMKEVEREVDDTATLGWDEVNILI